MTAPSSSVSSDGRRVDEPALRRSLDHAGGVLELGVSPAEVAAADDTDPESGHFAHLVDGVVGTGTIRRRPLPGDGLSAGRFEGGPSRLGAWAWASAVLAALLEHAEGHGGGPVWCHVRIAAVSLCERHGFETVGERFDDRVAGPQVLMICRAAAVRGDAV